MAQEAKQDRLIIHVEVVGADATSIKEKAEAEYNGEVGTLIEEETGEQIGLVFAVGKGKVGGHVGILRNAEIRTEEVF